MAIMRDIDAEATIFTATDAGDITVQPTEIEYNTARYDTAAQLTIKGLAEADDETVGSFPEASSEPTTVVCRASNSAAVDNDDGTIGPILASGELLEGSVNEDGVWEGTVVDAIRTLRQKTFSGQYEAIVINDLIEDILITAGIPEYRESPNSPDGRPSFIINTPEEIPVDREATGGRRLMYRTTREFNQTPAFEALNEVLESRNWWWWCTEENTIIVDDELPSEEHDIPYITETSAGKQSPPWQAVEVIGDRQPEGTRPGDPNATPEHIIGKGTEIRATAGNGQPVFTEVNRSIETEATAEALAEKILQELLAQQNGGTITALGDPVVRPLDAVRMPDHMGGESYLVSAITHTITSSDGYLMEIECGGLMDPGEGGEENTEDPTEGDGDGDGGDEGEVPGGPGGVQ